jgi:Tfp pilus assembly protein PilF
VVRQIGDRLLEGVLLNNMGEVAALLGHIEEAEKDLAAAEEICDECAEQRLLFEVMRNRGMLELRRADGARAKLLIERSLGLAKQLGSRVLEGIALRCLGEVHGHSLTGDQAERDAQLALADRTFQSSIEILREVGNEAELGRALLSYGTFLVEQMLTGQARQRIEEAAQIFDRLGMKRLLERAQERIAQL